MTNAISFLFQSWIIIYFNSCVSLEKNIQTFTCQKALSISTNAGSVTEVASRSATQCTVQCINDNYYAMSCLLIGRFSDHAFFSGTDMAY
jgi:hypothetical protein